MYSLASLGLGLAAAAASELEEARASTGAFGFSDKALMDINRLYARTKKVKAPPKSKAVQKRRKANKLAAKQRKSSK